MTDNRLNTIKQKILETNKISANELETKVQEKLSSLGGLISEEGALHIVANELGVVLGGSPVSEVKLKDVENGMKNVSVLVKVLRKYDVRTFGQDGQGKVGNIFVGDETGFSRVTFWNDKTQYLDKMNEGDIIEIQHAYSKENQDRIELQMGNMSHCIINPEGKTVEVKERQERPVTEQQEKKLNEITDEDTFVTITATIVQVYDPRFFESCPTCNKRVHAVDDGFSCAEHGVVTPGFNYVMNIFLDDGSTNLRAALWKEQVQQLLGKSDAEVIALKDNQTLLEDVKTDLLGKIIKARARVKKNEAYNTKELVLYEVTIAPQPPVSTQTSSTSESLTPDVAKSVEQASPVEEKVNADTIGEELLSEDDEELLSIDDIDDAL